MNFFLSDFSDGDYTMDKILDTTIFFLSSVCFRLLPTDVAWDNIFFFCSYQVITLAYSFGKIVPVTTIMDVISLLFSAMDNALLNASGHPPEDKTEEQITFALRHAHLYLSESYDERDNKSAAAKTFNITCGDGGYNYSLSAINVFVLATSDVLSC